MQTAATSQTNAALAKDFFEGLQRYHNVDGKGNGGGVPGLQLPPDVKPEALDGYMHEISDFLASQPTVKFNPAPTDPAARTAFRKEIAESRRVDVSSHVKANLDAALALIGTPAISTAVKQALAAAPPEFFKAPSSSSGKYHPADEINPGGLVLHSLRDVEVGRLLCDHFNIEGERKDEIMGSLILHDAQKGGIPWKDYAKEHGPMASAWLGSVWGTSDPTLNHMRTLVANHMAQWNAPAPTVPANLDEQIVSYADYLGSRDNVYVDTPTSH